MSGEARPKRIEEFLAQHGPAAGERKTSSGIPLDLVYGEEDDVERLGLPGEYPYVRGVHPSMYRGRFWTMRQYAGFGTAKETNERFRKLLAAGQTGLSTAFDLPTQMGYDPDHEMARPEVGKVGVSIATLEDMLELLEGIPLDKVSTSMTINATANILLALYVAVGRAQGVDSKALSGTLQNDILKEYAARGTYRFRPVPSIRLITDSFAWCAENAPRFNPISISGYHMREAGSTAAQEVAFTLANGIAYVQAAIDSGLDVDVFAKRLSFFFNAHNDFFEEIAKFRAARRLWAQIMRERFGARNPKSLLLRFHTQTAGSTLTSQQYENNVVRVAMQALAAVLGGTQSLHTNGRDEAMSLPTEDSARLALRTQQIIAYETGVCDTVDPLGGAPFVEHLTDELQQEAERLIAEVDKLGGSPKAIEAGFIQREIHQAAYRYQMEIEHEDRTIVGVNKFKTEEVSPPPFRIDDTAARMQAERIAKIRADRQAGEAQEALGKLVEAAKGKDNVIPHMLRCVEARVTLGEMCTALDEIFGRYQEVPVL